MPEDMFGVASEDALPLTLLLFRWSQLQLQPLDNDYPSYRTAIIPTALFRPDVKLPICFYPLIAWPSCTIYCPGLGSSAAKLNNFKIAA
jgi:hypothetical protein